MSKKRRPRKPPPAHNVPLWYRPRPSIRDITGPQGKSGRLQGMDLFRYGNGPNAVKEPIVFSPQAGRPYHLQSGFVGQDIKTVQWQVERTPQKLSILRSAARRTQAPTWVTRKDAGMYDYKHNVKLDGVDTGPGRYVTASDVDVTRTPEARALNLEERFKPFGRCCAEAANIFSRGFQAPSPSREIPRFEPKRKSQRAKVRAARERRAAQLREQEWERLRALEEAGYLVLESGDVKE
eukprot:g6297.t1